MVMSILVSLWPLIRYHERQFLMPANPMPAWFGFLRIEADLALTFIIVARNHLKPENAARSLGNARKALAVYAQALPAQHLYVASTRQLLGEILLQRGAVAAGSAVAALTFPDRSA